MNDAEFEEQKARVLAVFEKWSVPLWLEGYDTTFYWERTKGPERKMEGGDTHWQTTLKVNSNWTHMDAAITAYLGTIMNVTEVELETAVVHECMHILVCETRQGEDKGDDWLDHEERVCTMLAKAFMTVRQYAKEGKL